MKQTLITLLLVCTTTIALSQEHIATFGKYTGCLRTGGICTISSPPAEAKAYHNTNISFIIQKDGSTLLRIYRNKLSKEEEYIIFNKTITTQSKDTLQFTMLEAMPLSENLTAHTASQKSKQITVLDAKKISNDNKRCLYRYHDFKLDI